MIKLNGTRFITGTWFFNDGVNHFLVVATSFCLSLFFSVVSGIYLIVNTACNGCHPPFFVFFICSLFCGLGNCVMVCCLSLPMFQITTSKPNIVSPISSFFYFLLVGVYKLLFINSFQIVLFNFLLLYFFFSQY